MLDTMPCYVCPVCRSKRGLALIGLRSATEISASISQMFSFKFNDDKRTLTFSDNVQDAAHRAIFFNACTWKFGLHGAIQIKSAINHTDSVTEQDTLVSEKCLLYVALSRAQKQVFVTSYGKSSPFIIK